VDESVRLVRNTPRLRNLALIVCLAGIAGWLVAERFEQVRDTDRMKVSSFVLVVGALWVLATLLRPFVIEVSSAGLTLRSRGATNRLPWTSIDAVTVERASEENWNQPVLWIRLAPGVRLKRHRGKQQDGCRRYDLLGLDDFTIPPEAVVHALLRYGGDRIDAQDYLDHRAAKRLVAELLAEQRAEEAREKFPDGPAG